jgi:hypothetical protein
VQDRRQQLDGLVVGRSGAGAVTARGEPTPAFLQAPNGGVDVGSVAFVDVEGHAFAAYDATPGTVVEIRPDGYVAAIRAAS